MWLWGTAEQRRTDTGRTAAELSLHRRLKLGKSLVSWALEGAEESRHVGGRRTDFGTRLYHLLAVPP